MTIHPVQRKILENVAANNYGAAGEVLIALVDRHQPVKVDGRLTCDRCWDAGFGRSPYPCGDLRTICGVLGIDLREELETIAKENADHARLVDGGWSFLDEYH